MDALPPLLLFVLVATISPGGATTLATVSGANFGFRRSLPLIAGISLGLASMAAFAALGLSSVLLAAPSLTLAMKAVGSAYLLWLAWQMAGRGPPHLASNARPIGLFTGMWAVWHNPKGWAMTLGAAASFSALASGPVRLSMLLGAAFGGFAILSLTTWCAAGLVLARAMRRDAQWRMLNGGLGVLLALSILPIWFETVSQSMIRQVFDLADRQLTDVLV
ncbi:Threonine/homoserine/homoserine lactone efflux protein [Faunimonas pinastri]|uniref:Threonine/homoserine/homoserine lactone efflux protein n=1 Tax=Faunimonas pinastri TaxID=1855383 RepID=A0A1H9HRC6_9HYPH|nr:LysE family translocator [Faunimonas pinastri]SEQ64899.1 Threonine/homoserine/homoserine lactone efflux protein [Faunimonas pinastri]